MSKKVWFQPQAVAEQFVANEYVAACWTIKCDVDGRDGFNRDVGGHQDGYGKCGHEGSHFVRDCGNNTYEMKENSISFGRLLPCTVYPGGFNYETHTVTGTGSELFTITPEDIEKNPTGVKLYWTTEVMGAKYYHNGIVNLKNDSVKHS